MLPHETMACDIAEVHVEFGYDFSDSHLTEVYISSSRLLTSQLSSDSLERQLSELLDQRSELGAAD